MKWLISFIYIFISNPQKFLGCLFVRLLFLFVCTGLFFPGNIDFHIFFRNQTGRPSIRMLQISRLNGWTRGRHAHFILSLLLTPSEKEFDTCCRYSLLLRKNWCLLVKRNCKLIYGFWLTNDTVPSLHFLIMLNSLDSLCEGSLI